MFSPSPPSHPHLFPSLGLPLYVAFLPLIISLLPLLALPTSPHRPVSIFAFILVACTARPGRKKRHSQKKDGAVAAWSNVSWVTESQLHQLGQSPSRTTARRHFNAYHTATFASSCARAPAVVNWSLTQNALKWWCCLVLPYVIMSHAKNALKWWSCLVLPYVIIVTYPMTRCVVCFEGAKIL